MPPPLQAQAPQRELPVGGFGSASPHEKYRTLLKALKLTDDPALPTDHLKDVAYRKRVETGLAQQTEGNSCASIKTVFEAKEDGFRRAVLVYRVPKITTDMYAFLQVPDEESLAKGPYALALYNHAGFGGKFDRVELDHVLGDLQKNLAVAVPIFANEVFSFGGKDFKPLGENFAFVSEVDRFYGLAACLQHKATDVTLASKPLSERLLPSGGDVPGAKSIALGTGRGGLIALLGLARSGAWALAQKGEVTNWAHFECAALVNPLYSLYGAEARLMLAALVDGYTEDTRYKDIPGVVDLRRELFKKYRDGTLSAEDLAFELVSRDGFMTAPFVDVALKNFGAAATDKGPPAGSLLVMHNDVRTDFAINQSRIFANIASTVWFETDKNTNAMNFLYREFLGTPEDANNSYVSVEAKGFAMALGSHIPDRFVRVSDSLKDKAKQYNFLIRGRQFENSENLTPAQTLRLFLKNGCDLKI